tara:strand:- start:1616 stop:1951 length:336 start_codon:yes stop_codon:yes gene_type:complete
MRCFIASLMLLITGCVATDADLSTPVIGNIIALKPDQCLPTSAIVPLLWKNYDEELVSSGTLKTTDIPLVMMLFTSESGSWTVTTTSQDGLTCVLIWGENYRVNKSPGEKT